MRYDICPICKTNQNVKYHEGYQTYLHKCFEIGTREVYWDDNGQLLGLNPNQDFTHSAKRKVGRLAK